MCDVEVAAFFDSIPSLVAPLFDGVVYPWEVLPKISEYTKELIKRGIKGYKYFSSDVLVGEGVKIYDGACIEGPAVIASGCEVRPGAFIRGNVIVCESCVIGNSSELKNCVIFDKSQVPHYNYVGDSILGTHSHLGAGAICSNLKSDGKNVVVHAENDYDTGLRKFGAILADDADIGCGCVLNPGTLVGKNTSVYPLTSLRGAYPPNSIVKSTREVVPKI